MLTRFALSAILLVWGGIVFAGDPIPPQFDPFPPSPAPVVPPVPVGTPTKLAGKQVYVAAQASPFVLRAYPSAAVTVKKYDIAAGETHHFEKDFADGKTEKSFKGPQTVYFVTPAGKGIVDLVATPFGLKAEADIKTVGLDVDAGIGPQPPPNPVDPPKPVPVTSFRALIVRDTAATHSAAQISVMDGKAVADFLNANCTPNGDSAGWRRYSKAEDATGEDPIIKALWAAVQPKLTAMPCIAVEVNGKADIIPLAATPAEMVATLKKYKEGK